MERDLGRGTERTNRMSEGDTMLGSTKLSIYLHGVTDAQVNDLMDKLGDFVVANGFGNEDDEDSILRSIVIAYPEDFPADEKAWQTILRDQGAACLLLPTNPNDSQETNA